MAPGRSQPSVKEPANDHQIFAVGFSPHIANLEKTRTTFPSTTGVCSPYTIDEIAAAVYGPTPLTLSHCSFEVGHSFDDASCFAPSSKKAHLL